MSSILRFGGEEPHGQRLDNMVNGGDAIASSVVVYFYKIDDLDVSYSTATKSVYQFMAYGVSLLLYHSRLHNTTTQSSSLVKTK